MSAKDAEDIVTEVMQAWKDEGVLHPRRAAQDVLSTLDAEGYVVEKACSDQQERDGMTATKKRPVVVTTEHRGVFFGFMNGGEATDKTVVLTDAQMCVYWSADVNGVLGLASSGPSKGCRVSPKVPKITLQAVTAVVDTTSEAVKAWQARPWS